MWFLDRTARLPAHPVFHVQSRCISNHLLRVDIQYFYNQKLRGFVLHHVDIWMPEFWRLFPLACFAGSGERCDELLRVFWGWFKCLLALRGRALTWKHWCLSELAEDLNLGYQAPVLHCPLEEPCPRGAQSWKICPKSVNARSYFAWISSAEMASGNGRCFQRHQSNFCKQWKKKHSVLSPGSSHFVLFVEILQIWMYF